jgi:hypothetical protein
MRGAVIRRRAAALLLWAMSGGVAAAQGVCGVPGNLPRMSVSDLDFGPVPGLVGRPWEGVASLILSCPRSTDALPRLRVVALGPDGEAELRQPRGVARVRVLPGAGVSLASVPGGVVVAEHPGQGGARALFRLRLALLRDQPLSPGAYNGSLMLQLRLD